MRRLDKQIDLACNIFVNADAKQQVENLLTELGNSIGNGIYHVHQNEIELIENSDYNPAKISGKNSLNDFLFYKFKLEIHPLEDDVPTLTGQVELVVKILKMLEQKGLSALPACDYEDEIKQKL